mmetsp:Transcript_54825/g.174201  ORF Transcript_54825/g.174201 Transcript_54825/m.174201 type:complete len:208 (+) Transcript_54825:1263-1886(+)
MRGIFATADDTVPTAEPTAPPTPPAAGGVGGESSCASTHALPIHVMMRGRPPPLFATVYATEGASPLAGGGGGGGRGGGESFCASTHALPSQVITRAPIPRSSTCPAAPAAPAPPAAPATAAGGSGAAAMGGGVQVGFGRAAAIPSDGETRAGGEGRSAGARKVPCTQRRCMTMSFFLFSTSRVWTCVDTLRQPAAAKRASSRSSVK